MGLTVLNDTLLGDTDPKRFIADFYRALNDDLVNTDEDSGVIIDRYHTPDIVQVADGHRMDRDKLIAHTRPVRKNRPTSRMEVHEALRQGDTLAARYTLHVRNPKRDFAIEVCFFGRFAPDGRMCEANMLTRMLPGQDEAPA
ncbi:nuclear transport factor 2 family protein [Spongiactinospora rosea]|uniref:Nuclear transport factor 2 family protein n=1 Tax=Spongiactinospora rosea TaxID=2248750 RepID=A0A366M9F7_9ACTN|nr:nuclear transport factor 2 family protein [Spongiactinospora rosea]RBQ22112.1 nuclear transport factor 2 family protein [Spongiactinospora rosea]